MGNRDMVRIAKLWIDHNWLRTPIFRRGIFSEKLILICREGKRKIHLNPITDTWEMVGFDENERKEIYVHFKMRRKEVFGEEESL